MFVIRVNLFMVELILDTDGPNPFFGVHNVGRNSRENERD